jgi:2-succinyl-5-enolpyruvyl-6-hydroxy-3-cyclohexene-1-carboxylate synthase
MDDGDRTCAGPIVLVDELVRAGVADAVVAPGSRSAPLALACGAHPGLRVFSHVDERAAGFFALGLARAARRPVAIVCTSGTAAANLLPAVVEAFHAGVPLVVCTADRPPELRDCAAPQTIDQVRLFGSHVRWFFELGPLDATPALLRHARTVACRAVAIGTGRPPGPVHLNVPLREPLVPATLGALPDALLADALLAAAPRAARGRDVGPWTHVAAPDATPSPRTVADVAAALASARRPLVVAGPLDDADPDLPAAVATLAVALGAPVLAETASNLRRAPLLPHLVDAHDVLLRSPTFAADADAVVRLGLPPTSKPLATWLARRDDVPHVLLDAAGVWTDPAGVVSHVVRGALGATCRALAAALPHTRAASLPAAERDTAWAARWRRAGAAARRALAQDAAGAAPFEAHAVTALAASLPADARLYVGNSLAVRALDWFWPADAPPVRVLANRGANGIDGFVSSVLGAAAASDAPAVGLCGDLTFLHDLGGLLAVRRHGLRAVFVVLDNDGGGIFDHLPVAATGGRYEELFVTPHGLDVAPAVAMYGARFVRVDDADALQSALTAALGAAQTTVIALRIARADSLAAHRAAFAAGLAAVEAA